MEIAIPVESALTICTHCEHYIFMTLDNRHCAKAKAISIDPVSGSRQWETNGAKNQGNCSDYAPAPKIDPSRTNQPRVVAHSLAERVALAKEILSTGVIL